MIIIGVVATSIPFFSSMNPSARAEAEKEAWNTPPMPNMSNGEVIIRQIAESNRREYPNGGWSPDFGKRDLLIRDYIGDFYSYRLPTWEGAVVMPRIFWQQWEGMCKSFGPKLENGMLIPEETIIQCQDPGEGNWSPSEARWSIDGKSLVKPYPDLPKLRCRKQASGKLQCM